MKEHYYDKLLNIKTVGSPMKNDTFSHYFPYEPTPYSALDTLFTEYELASSDRLVDFGCGKGRLNFYVHYHFNASVIGIEMNEVFYLEALENKNTYVKQRAKAKHNIQFHCCLAEDYKIHPKDNRFYFFNPFSEQIFMKVINNILLSVEQSKREIELIFYYGTGEYTYYLENQTPFELKQEVKLPELYEKNPYERFLIYRLSY